MPCPKVRAPPRFPGSGKLGEQRAEATNARPGSAFQPPGVELQHPGAAGRQVFVMGHQDQGSALVGVEGEHQVDDLLAGGRVQVAGGLVGQHQPGRGGEGPGDGDALLLAAGQMLGGVGKPVLQPDRDLLRLEEEIADAIGATVKIKANKKGAGELTIRFGSLDQLDGVLGRLR